MMKNQNNELVPIRIQNGWRVCIAYRNLNSLIIKDHFPLSFMDQMLERIAGCSHYCFLNGYSGYNQIVIASEGQEKTIFTFPFSTFANQHMPFGLCNTPATFSQIMQNTSLRYLWMILLLMEILLMYAYIILHLCQIGALKLTLC